MLHLHGRKKTVVALLGAMIAIVWMAVGCSGGGGGQALQQSSAGPQTGALKVSLRLEPAATARVHSDLQGVTSLTFHVLDATTLTDVIAPVSLPLTGTGPVTATLQAIPVGVRILHVDALANSAVVGSAQSSPLNIVPGQNIAPPLTVQLTAVPTQLAFLTQPVGTTVNTVLSPAVQVAVEDASGHLVTTANNTVQLSLSANPGEATLGGTLTQTAVNGIATFNDLTISQVANGYTLAATGAGLTSATSQSFNVVTSVGTATHIAFATEPTDTSVNQAFNPAVQVALEDSSNAVVTSATNPITLSLNGNGNLNGTVTVTPVNGVATFSTISVSQVGAGDTLTASAGGFATVDSTSFTINAANGANQLVFSVQPPTSVGAGFQFSVQVSVVNESSQTISSNTDPITLTLSNNTSGGVLSGTTTVNAVNGVANFTGLSINVAQTNYDLTATDNNLPNPNVVSSFFNVVAPNPVSVAITPNGLFLYAANFSLNSVTGYAINQSTGALTPLPGSPFTVTQNQSANLRFCTVSPDGKVLLVTDQQGGDLISCTINNSTGALTPVSADGFSTGGATPIGIAVDPTSAFVFTPNENSNSLAGFSINSSSGVLTQLAGFPTTAGIGDSPFGVNFDNSGDLFVVNSSVDSNSVSAFNFDSTNGLLNQVSGSPFSTGGSVPSYAAFDPSSSLLFVANDSSNNVTSFFDSDGGLFPVTGSPFSAGSLSFDPIVDPSGSFLYVINNQSFNISAYSIGSGSSTGQLTTVTGQPFACGQFPNGIIAQTINSQEFLYTANFGDNTISGFVINTTTGALTPITGSPFTD